MMTAPLRIGAMHNASWKVDAKHLGFVLARYHFVARMLKSTDAKKVLEVGCGDCTGACVVRDVVDDWTGIDNGCQETSNDALVWDIIKDGPLPDRFDAVYALDVLEHIEREHEDLALRNMATMVRANGTVIIGMPSLESQPYASELSKRYHVNCKTEPELGAMLRRHFHNVFLFGMNDTTLHTGFGPLCHYRLAVCAGPR